MSGYEQELARAKREIAALGRDPGAFDFAMAYLPPDPDGGGMFTVQYAVTVTNRATGRSVATTGGNELDWVAELLHRFAQGRLD